MAYQLIVTATYDTDPDLTFQNACDFAEVAEAMKGLATYDGLPTGRVFEGQTALVDVTLWGFLKTRGHSMTVVRLDKAARILQSREHNPNVKHWDHTLTVQPTETGCVWTDSVVIDAGWNSWGTVRFAKLVYTRRHKHRKALNIETQIKRL